MIGAIIFIIRKGYLMKKISLLTAVVCCGVSASMMADEKKVVAKPQVTQNKQVASNKSETLKIGTWDMYKNLSKDGSSKDKQVAINEKQTAEATRLEEKRQKSAKRLEEFNAKKDVLAKDVREKEEKELLALSRELQAEVQKAQELVRAEVNKLTEELALEAETAAIEVAKATGLDLLIEKNTGRVVYEKTTSFDITEKVAEKMNKNYEVKLAQNKKAEAKDTVKTASLATEKTTEAVKKAAPVKA